MSIADQINEVLRRVDFDDSHNSVTLTQTFATTIDDLWNACTEPERLARWFEPIDAELREGGHYRLIDSGTTGRIEKCEAPHALSLTWVHGDNSSRVKLVIDQAGPQAARLTLSHHSSNDDYWHSYGPAARGVGWDAALLGLSHYLDEPTVSLDDLYRLMASEKGAHFAAEAAKQWSLGHQRAGAAPDYAQLAAERAVALERSQWVGP